MSTNGPVSGTSSPKAVVIVISGPSGVGKSVICHRLVRDDSTLVLSISATTRPPRGKEKDGVDYDFHSEEEFRDLIDRGYFVEWAEVHGSLYGTPREKLEEAMARGQSPLLDVDVQGGHSIKQLMPDAVMILIEPPSMEELERRLRGRRSDSEETVRKRLAKAREELARAGEYDHVVTNRVLDDTVAEIQAILARERGGKGPPRV